MVSIIDDLPAGVIGGVIGGFVGYILFLSIVNLIKKDIEKRREKTPDVNIEWYGPEIYLKEKQYGEIENNFDSELLD